MCCESQDTVSATPSHTIFATSTGSTDTLDPSGWLYTLAPIENFIRISSVEISSLWGGQSLGFPYTGCPYISCNLPASTAAGAVYASSVAYLFATTTIITSGSANPASTATTSTGETSSERTTVEVDPVTAKPTASTPVSSESDASGITPPDTSSTVVQQLPSSPSTAQQATMSNVVQPSLSAPSPVHQDTTQPLTSTGTQASSPPISSGASTDQTVGGQSSESGTSERPSTPTNPEPHTQTSTQNALSLTPDESSVGQNGGGQVSEAKPSAGLSTPTSTNLPAQSSFEESPSTVQSAPSQTQTPGAVGPTYSSTGQFVTSSFTLVLVSSAAPGEALSTTTLVFVTRPSETALQAGSSSTVPQTSNAVIGTASSTNLGQLSTLSATALPQDTASSKQVVSGPSVPNNGGDSFTSNARSTESVAAIVVGGSTIAPDASSQYIVSGQSLLPGSSITLVQGSSTAVIALPTDQSEVASSLVITGNTLSPTATTSAVPIVIGSNTITPDASSAYVISGQTLAAGSEITLVSGTSSAVVALRTSNSQTYLVVGTSSVLSEQTAARKSYVPIIVGTNTIQPDASSNYVISGQTLSLGSKITLVSGSSTAIIALQISNSQTYLVIGASISALPEQTASQGSIQIPVFTIGSSTVTPNSASEYVVASQTLHPGAAITVSGSVISLASHATEIVIGTSTQTAAYQQGLGGYILSALGATSTTPKSPASDGSTIAFTKSSGFPSSSASGGISLASGLDSVLSPASGTSSVSSMAVISTSSSGASQQGSTSDEVRGSITSTLSNSAPQATSTSNAVRLRSAGVGLVVFLCVVAFVVM